MHITELAVIRRFMGVDGDCLSPGGDGGLAGVRGEDEGDEDTRGKHGASTDMAPPGS